MNPLIATVRPNTEPRKIGAILEPIIDGWIATSPSDPLVISPQDDGQGSVSVSIGYPKSRLSQNEACKILDGCCPRTFKKRYLDTGILKAGVDGKFSLKKVLEAKGSSDFTSRKRRNLRRGRLPKMSQ